MDSYQPKNRKYSRISLSFWRGFTKGADFVFRYIDQAILRKIASYGTKTKWGEIFNSDKPRWEMMAKEKQLVKQGYAALVINMYMELAPLLAENEAIYSYNKNLDAEIKSLAKVQFVDSLECAMELALAEHPFMQVNEQDSLKELLLSDELVQPIEEKVDVASLISKLMAEKYFVYRDRIISGLSEIFMPCDEDTDINDLDEDDLQSVWEAACCRVCEDGLGLGTYDDAPVIEKICNYCYRILSKAPLHEIKLLWLFSDYGESCQVDGKIDGIPQARHDLEIDITENLLCEIEEVIKYNYCDDDYSYWEQDDEDDDDEEDE